MIEYKNFRIIKETSLLSGEPVYCIYGKYKNWGRHETVFIHLERSLIRALQWCWEQ